MTVIWYKPFNVQRARWEAPSESSWRASCAEDMRPGSLRAPGASKDITLGRGGRFSVPTHPLSRRRLALRGFCSPP